MPERIVRLISARCPGCRTMLAFEFTQWPEHAGRNLQIEIGDLPVGYKAIVSGKTGSNLAVTCPCGEAAWSSEPVPQPANTPAPVAAAGE